MISDANHSRASDKNSIRFPFTCSRVIAGIVESTFDVLLATSENAYGKYFAPKMSRLVDRKKCDARFARQFNYRTMNEKLFFSRSRNSEARKAQQYLSLPERNLEASSPSRITDEPEALHCEFTNCSKQSHYASCRLFTFSAVF